MCLQTNLCNTAHLLEKKKNHCNTVKYWITADFQDIP